MGVLERREHDIYFVAPANDQNIKLREDAGHWVLKLKVLLARAGPGKELYREDPRKVFGFPLSRETIESAASLLDIRIPDEPPSELAGVADLRQLIARSLPLVTVVEVFKSRSQFQIDNGWLELAQVDFPGRRTESLSIHSAEVTVLERWLANLAPDKKLLRMNYVEACRLWGSANKKDRR
jgi:hypothetical protein